MNNLQSSYKVIKGGLNVPMSDVQLLGLDKRIGPYPTGKTVLLEDDDAGLFLKAYEKVVGIEPRLVLV